MSKSPIQGDPWSSSSPFSRRTLVRSAAAGLGALMVPGMLAACGGDGGGGSSQAAAELDFTTPVANGRIDYLGFEGLDFKQSADFQKYMSSNGAEVVSKYWTSFKDGIAAFPAGRAKGVDIIHASSCRIPQILEFGDVLQPLDPERIPNLAKLLPEFRGTDKPWYQDGKLYAVPFATSPFCLNWNAKRIKTDLRSWAELKEPRFKNRICVYNDPAALMWTLTESLKLGPQGRLPKDAGKKAGEELKRYVDNARILASGLGDVVTAFTNGDIDACYVGSPIISVLANQSGAGSIKFNMEPTDGNTLCTEAQAVAATSDNVESAYAYLNEALQPRANADFTNILIGGPAREGAYRYLSPECEKAFPPGTIKRLESKMPYSVPLPLESDEFLTEPEWTEIWTSITGA